MGAAPVRANDSPAHVGVLRGIVSLTRKIKRAEADLGALYEQRVVLYEEGQALDPPITQPRLAAAAECTEMAVGQALAKRRKRRALEEAHQAEAQPGVAV